MYSVHSRLKWGVTVFFSFFLLTASAQNSVKQNFQNAAVYAGIEVGSKGVKMSLLEVGKSSKKNSSFTILKDTSVNTDFISFTQPTFQATLNGLHGLFTVALKNYEIPSDRIFTVFSSGVKIQAEKDDKNSWILSMADSFKKRINEPLRQVNVIDVTEEARLSHLGIVPATRRYNTFLIDIGSGNTKGGYFPGGNTKDFKLFQLTWGTKSVANAVDKRTQEDKTLPNFNKQLYRVLAGEANTEVIYAVNLSGAYNMSDNIAFSGGIAWSVATLMLPELVENPVVPVTYDEVLKFSEKLYTNHASFSDSAIKKNLTDVTLDKNLIGTEVKRVNKVFDQRSLMAGTGLLLKIMRQFEGIYDKKQFFLVKNGAVGWISAYVDQSISGTK
ncbi:MAG TPA: hypothetical protein PLC48_04510 [Ferruginibacter sp.]|nr:hypothetical protein [Ferruginibacter sp.]